MAKGQDPTQTSTATTTQELSPEQRTLLDKIMPAFNNFSAFTPQRYQGPTVAGFDPSQTKGQEMALGAAGAQQDIADRAKATSDFYLGGDIWNPSSNPYLQSAVDTSVRPITQQLTESQLPAIRGGSVAAGYGGSRQGIAEGLASGRASQAIGDTASKVVQNQYDTNVRAQLQALGLVPTIQTAQTTPAATTSDVGDVRQALQQALLNEKAGNFNLDQLLQIAPYLQAKDLLGVIQGIPGGSTVSSSTGVAQMPKANPGMQALGGAASGAALGSLFGPVGTGVGALGGAVLPFLFQ